MTVILLKLQSESKTHVGGMHLRADLHEVADGHAWWHLLTATTA